MFGWLGSRVVRRPWLVVAAWVLAVGALVTFAPQLSDVTNSDQASFLPEDAESVRAQEIADEAFPQAAGATGLAVVTRSGGGALTAADRTAVAAAARELGDARLPGVSAVGFDPREGVSPNGEVALVQIVFDGQSTEERVLEAVPEVRSELAAALPGDGLSALVTGDAPLQVDNEEAFADAEQLSFAITVGLIVVLLLVIFRSPIAALLPLVTIGLVFAGSTSLVALLADLLGFEVGQELSALLVVVLFGLGTDYILFLLFRYRERLRAGEESRAAMVTSVERVGEAIASAGLAVIAAFSALLLATLGFLTTLGPGLAISVAVTLLAALTLVPAVVTLLGPRVFWPSKSWRHQRPSRVFAGLGRLVARRPAAVVAGSLAVLLALGAGALGFAANYDSTADLPDSAESTQGLDALQRGFPAGALNPTQVYLVSDGGRLDPAVLGAYGQRLAAVEGVGAVRPAELSADGRTARLSLVLEDSPYSSEALDVVAGPVRDVAQADRPAGTTAYVGGQTQATADIRAAVNRDLLVIFPVAAGLFLVILVLLLRAVLAPVYLVLSAGLGFVATLGAAVLVFQGIGGAAGLSFIIPVLIYLFVTAIGTDYNILMSARLREEVRAGATPRQAAALAVEHAGPSVASAAVILAGTFASFLVTGVAFLYQIGFAVTVGVLVVAFVVALLLVPALTALVGARAWWPGHSATPDADRPAPERAASGVG